MKALYPGSFDPITLGHLDIAKRASKIFDEVTILIMKNSKKTSTFTELERKEMIQECIKEYPNISVEIGEGLTVEYAKKHGYKVLIRGIRAVVDYENELAQATGNMKLDNEIETMFFVAKPEYSFLSSSIAKEIASLNGDISGFIPEEIKDKVIDRLSK